MSLSKRAEKELLLVYNSWWKSYLNGDIATYDSFLDDDFRFVGSTGGEEFLNRKETTDFFEATADQLAGKAKLENVDRSIEVIDEIVLITDLADAFVLAGTDWVYYARFRFTSILRKTQNGWRFFYQHFSTPDLKAEDGETIGLDKILSENLELRNAIKRRTAELEIKNRDLEIEAALERVRSRAMGMINSNELSAVASMLFNQISELNIDVWTAGFNVWSEDDKEYEDWITSPKGGFIEPYKVDTTEFPVFIEVREAKQRGDAFFVQYVEGEMLKGMYRQLSDFAPAQFEKMLEDGFQFPKYQYNHFVFGSSVSLMFITFEPLPEAHHIFKRFGKVFQQTFTRFLDLQKAEAQAREAQIEVSLERVRARSMAMHRTDELADTAMMLFAQVTELGIDLRSCGFLIMDDKKQAMEDWSANIDEHGKSVVVTGTLAYDQHPILSAVVSAWRKGDPYIIAEVHGDDLQKYYKAVTTKESTTKAVNKKVLAKATSEYTNSFYFKYGMMYVLTPKPISDHEINILMRFAGVFKLTYRRFLDIEKAEAQAREAQIEAALERVRSKTMAMHNSEDVGHTVISLFDEVLKLGLDKTIRCGIGILENREHMETWSANLHSNGEVLLKVGKLSMDVHPMLKGLKKAWKSGQARYSYDFAENDVHKYYKALNDEPEYEFNANLETLAKKEFHNSFFFSSGILFAFTENPLSEEGAKVLDRFSDVFGQTYRRYLDLRKAEAQAKEAQIEGALEKVRSRSLTMQRSNDLSAVIKTISEELYELNIRFSNVSFGIDSDDSDYTFWTSISGQSDPIKITVPYIDHPITKAISEARKNKQDFLIDFFPAEIHRIWLNHTIEHSALKSLSKKERENLQNLPLTRSAALLPNIFLVVTNYKVKPYSDTDNAIIARFGHVFEQSYRRFLDLEKAEEQAREAKIEAALERVRASSMAMHKSEQLAQTAEVLFEQFDLLGVIPDRISIGIYNEKKRLFELWATDQSGTNVNHGHNFSIDEPTCMSKTYRAWKAGNESFIVDLKGKNLEDWIHYVKEEAKMELDESQFKGRRVQHCAFFSQGYLLLSSHLPISDDMMQLLLRFAKVFQQTYTRFLDLQNAEKQAKDAIKRASVDRVRAEIASMRTSTDLNRITPLVWNELKTLNVPFIRCGVFIMDQEQQQVHTHLSTPDGKAIASFQLPFENTEPLDELLTFWRKKEMYTDYWDEAAFIQSTKVLMNRGAITSKENYITDNQPSSLHLHFLPFLQGMLYVGSDGTLTEEELSLVQDLAEAFSSAYARYEDFNKLELANIKIEKTLVDLKQAQSQLVQSEKMASLGELTAGIAHEIQNPLNFVNNFSEVSQELMQEMHEEIKNGEVEEAMEIGNDIEENLKKIHHHGKRASEIVKGMLQHSRSSSGVKELTDINAFTDEYLRLAYHGLRAKDKSFNAKMETDFDENLEKIEVIPQEIGRVILNLITNAFYAVNERKKQENEDFDPKVIVSTKKLKMGLEINVADNGNGIPKKVLGKIFQPFFTTKPTGQGTGLGLSLSYDIVKAHGGELKVETVEGEGTQFLIVLPV